MAYGLNYGALGSDSVRRDEYLQYADVFALVRSGLCGAGAKGPVICLDLAAVTIWLSPVPPRISPNEENT